MEDIVLNVPWGDERIIIKLGKVTGVADAIWWTIGIVYNNTGGIRVYGDIHRYASGWEIRTNKDSGFSFEDEQIMLALVQESEGMEVTAQPI